MMFHSQRSHVGSISYLGKDFVSCRAANDATDDAKNPPEGIANPAKNKSCRAQYPKKDRTRVKSLFQTDKLCGVSRVVV